MSDISEVRLTSAQARAVAEIAEDHEGTIVVRAHRGVDHGSFVEVAVKRDFTTKRAFIVDRDGGYHRLPMKKQQQ